MSDKNSTQNYRSLYDITGNIKDINTMLIPYAELAAMRAAGLKVGYHDAAMGVA